MCEVPVFGVVGGFCGCVMGVMGLWFVFGGWGWVLFSFVAGTGCGSDGCGFWSCLLGCGWLVVMGGLMLFWLVSGRGPGGFVVGGFLG